MSEKNVFFSVGIRYLNRLGVEIGDVDVLVYGRPMSGRR